MGNRKSSSSEGGGAVFVVLLLGWLIVKFIWWIVAALVAVGLFHLARAIAREARRRREIAAQRCAAISARADQQHNWALQGDDRGTFGVEGAKLMREIRATGNR